MPPLTDERIEAIVARIRDLCALPISDESEGELRKLALELRAAINQHMQLAKDSLAIKGAAINEFDPESPKNKKDPPPDL